jgi:hypothetical protein
MLRMVVNVSSKIYIGDFPPARGFGITTSSLENYLVLTMASGWLVAIAVVQAALFSDGSPSLGALWAASTRAEAGFMLSTIDVGIRIVVPRSFVVS